MFTLGAREWPPLWCDSWHLSLYLVWWDPFLFLLSVIGLYERRIIPTPGELLHRLVVQVVYSATGNIRLFFFLYLFLRLSSCASPPFVFMVTKRIKRILYWLGEEREKEPQLLLFSVCCVFFSHSPDQLALSSNLETNRLILLRKFVLFGRGGVSMDRLLKVVATFSPHKTHSQFWVTTFYFSLSTAGG
jgi:hypothetical protein